MVAYGSGLSRLQVGCKLTAMAPKTPSELRAEAEKLAAAGPDWTVVTADRTAIVDALTVDLGAAEVQAVIVDNRLLTIEAQTRTLSEAAIALSDAAANIASAVKGLRDDLLNRQPAAHA